MSDATGRPMIELRATAHLMRLDPGLFCVFNKPGAAAPDPQTGLPGVRLSAAPGPDSGQVTLSGFSADGWLSVRDDAALLRVSGGPAQVLVTIYQAADSGHEAPQLQFLRLNEPVRPVPAAAPNAAPIEAMAHIYGRGDVPGWFGEWVGERGSRRWIEGFALQPQSVAADIEYQAVLGRGWLSPWAEAGQFCGSRGMSLPILGLRVRLRAAAAAAFALSLEATFVDGSAAGPIVDGEACEAASSAALEAFRVVLVAKEEVAKAAAPAVAEAVAPARGKRKR